MLESMKGGKTDEDMIAAIRSKGFKISQQNVDNIHDLQPSTKESNHD